MRIVRAQDTPKLYLTGTVILSVFDHQMRFDLRQSFPLGTMKYCYLRSIIYELLGFLNSDTNIAYLQQNNVSIWNAWAE